MKTKEKISIPSFIMKPLVYAIGLRNKIEKGSVSAKDIYTVSFKLNEEYEIEVIDIRLNENKLDI
jgi:hypothetical protein